LPGHLGQDEVFAGLEDRDFGNLGLLMQLLRGKLCFFRSAFGLSFDQGILQEHLLQQIIVVKAFGIALQEGDGSQCALLRVEVFGLLEFQQRRDVERPDGSRMTTRSRCLNVCTRKKRSTAAPQGSIRPR